MTSRGALECRTALVTGASSGIGRATACALHREGARVALVARRGEALREFVSALGDRALAVEADVTDPDAVAHAVEQVSDEFGPPRIAVSCAGLCEPLELERLTARDWERTIATNLSASYYVARDCGLRMRADGGGSIVNIGSEMGAIGARGYVAYAASKAGVAGLTRALAAELAPHVTVNAVCPGPVDTPMLRAELEQTGDAPAAMRAEIERVPLKRIATADEVAAAVLFLATNAGFATGTMLALDGGTTIV